MAEEGKRLKGFCVVKKEFQLGWDFKNPFETEKSNKESNKRKRKGMNKGRSKKQLGLKDRTPTEKQLCFKIAVDGKCNKENCKYSHDLENYLKGREPDVGDICPLFKEYGTCNYGVKCLFSKGHSEQNKPIITSTYQDDVQNTLPYEKVSALRKKKYEFVFKSENRVNKHTLNFKGKVYVAPLTTVGNLPFRRIVKEFGADVTCGEMAMARNLLEGKLPEWALVKKHKSEDFFGIQLADSDPNKIAECSVLLANEVKFDFIDLNLGCPIELVTNYGAGSALMNRHKKLRRMVEEICLRTNNEVKVGIKMRKGWNSNKPNAHKLCPKVQLWNFEKKLNIAYVAIHGRSRQQRYTKLADWNYIHDTCAKVTAESVLNKHDLIKVIGNGDIMSYTQWYDELERKESIESHLKEANESLEIEEKIELSNEFKSELTTIMLARGVLIKPWLCQEIKEKRHIDISSSERLEMIKKFINYGLCHWGSDRKGINNTRRYLLEWMSFLYRYVPFGLLEKGYIPQYINDRPPLYKGRSDIESLLSSPNVLDWIKISELFLGKVDNDFIFVPKHKANAYEQPSLNITNILANQ